MTFNKEWLIQRYPDIGSIPFLFFWGHKPSADGSITKSCFSQWWIAPFQVDGVTYPTAEHWMMAGKAKLFGDTVAFEKIVVAKTPAAAKKIGRLVQNFDPELWDRHKFELVVTGNGHKFSRHPALKDFLLATGEQVLVEASPMDKVWGIGMAAESLAAKNPASWKGSNLLGFALMEVREKLKE
jgi:ribA/ribD-fused uncharacterized protein